ncbi:MAG: hypothetical protein LBV80_02770 [Deltaproteobacteria bacterium]|jgi:hypothetical protein|nr:hypothetical protein [Deltaproteobacteria bacterium]
MTQAVGGVGASSAINAPGGGSLQLQFAKLQLALSATARMQVQGEIEAMSKAQQEQQRVCDMLQQARQLQLNAKSSGKSTDMPPDMKEYITSNGLAYDESNANAAEITKIQNEVKQLNASLEQMQKNRIYASPDIPVPEDDYMIWGSKEAQLSPEHVQSMLDGKEGTKPANVECMLQHLTIGLFDDLYNQVNADTTGQFARLKELMDTVKNERNYTHLSTENNPGVDVVGLENAIRLSLGDDALKYLYPPDPALLYLSPFDFDRMVTMAKADMSKKTELAEEMANSPAQTADQWEEVVTSLKAKLDTMGTDTQQKMIFVQDYMGQYNAYMQGANSAIQQSNQVLTELARTR